MLYRMTTFLCLGLSAALMGQMNPEQALDRMQFAKEPPHVALEYMIGDGIEEVGKVEGAFKPAKYLTNEDKIYLDIQNERVSRGDRFIIYEDHGKIKKPGQLFGSVGKRIQILGFVRITDVHQRTIEGEIYDAREKITRGHKIGPHMNVYVKLEPQNPEVEVRGQIVGSTNQSYLIGTHETAFIDKGTEDGLRINDRLFVVRSADNVSDITEGLPEIPIAELVVIHASANAATVFVRGSNASFEKGSHFRTPERLVQYLE